MASQTYKQWSVVTPGTFAFTVCFMVWMMFAVIGIPIKKTLDFNETQFGIVWEGRTGPGGHGAAPRARAPPTFPPLPPFPLPRSPSLGSLGGTWRGCWDYHGRGGAG